MVQTMPDSLTLAAKLRMSSPQWWGGNERSFVQREHGWLAKSTAKNKKMHILSRVIQVLLKSIQL